jgi:hypothetical protein
MGRKSTTGGVCAIGQTRIQFDFNFDGVRYRPTLLRTPTEANLRRARQQLVGIKTRIAAGTFSLAEEFPDYVHLGKVPRAGSPRTCNHVFDDFLAHCAARVAKDDLAPVTLSSYRRGLDAVWRSPLGALRFWMFDTPRSLRSPTAQTGARNPITTRSAFCAGRSNSAIAITLAKSIPRAS